MELTDFAKTLSEIRETRMEEMKALAIKLDNKQRKLVKGISSVFEKRFKLEVQENYIDREEYSFYLNHEDGLIYISYHWETTEFRVMDFQLENDRLETDVEIFLEMLNNVWY